MSKLDKESVIGITALLVHAANIDEIYSDHEKELIKLKERWTESKILVIFQKVYLDSFPTFPPSACPPLRPPARVGMRRDTFES